LIVVIDSLFSQTFVEAMRSHLELVTDTVDTSLEASLPEKTGNKKVSKKVAGLGITLEQSLDSRPTRVELAVDFAEMAVQMAGGSSLFPAD
jgi:hypothetical protein